jgi:hypothetical protein
LKATFSDNVDAALAQSGQRDSRLDVVHEAAEQRHANREAREAVGDRGEVLAREQRRGHQEGGLLAVLDGLEGGANGDLGLAEADVGADQPVHRARHLHVGLHVLDRLGLVGRERVGEELLHLTLPRRIGAEGVPDGDVALAVEVDQLLSDEVGGRPGLGPGLLPLRPAHARQRRAVSPRVERQRVDLLGRPVAAPVLELEDQVVAGRAVDRPGRRTREPRHAVLAVHHETTN